MEGIIFLGWRRPHHPNELVSETFMARRSIATLYTRVCGKNIFRNLHPASYIPPVQTGQIGPDYPPHKTGSRGLSALWRSRATPAHPMLRCDGPAVDVLPRLPSPLVGSRVRPLAAGAIHKNAAPCASFLRNVCRTITGQPVTITGLEYRTIADQGGVLSKDPAGTSAVFLISEYVSGERRRTSVIFSLLSMIVFSRSMLMRSTIPGGGRLPVGRDATQMGDGGVPYLGIPDTPASISARV